MTEVMPVVCNSGDVFPWLTNGVIRSVISGMHTNSCLRRIGINRREADVEVPDKWQRGSGHSDMQQDEKQPERAANARQAACDKLVQPQPTAYHH